MTDKDRAIAESIIDRMEASPSQPAPPGERESPGTMWWEEHVEEFTDIDAPTEKVWRFGNALDAYAAHVLEEAIRRVREIPVVGDATDTEFLFGFKMGARSAISVLTSLKEGK